MKKGQMRPIISEREIIGNRDNFILKLDPCKNCVFLYHSLIDVFSSDSQFETLLNGIMHDSTACAVACIAAFGEGKGVYSYLCAPSFGDAEHLEKLYPIIPKQIKILPGTYPVELKLLSDGAPVDELLTHFMRRLDERKTRIRIYSEPFTNIENLNELEIETKKYCLEFHYEGTWLTVQYNHCLIAEEQVVKIISSTMNRHNKKIEVKR